MVICLLPYRTISSAIAFILIIWAITLITIKNSFTDFLKRIDPIIVVIFIFPTLAILISQSLGRGWFVSEYDGPIRLMLCIPLYYILRKTPYNLINTLSISLPIAIFFTFLTILLIPQSRDGVNIILFSASTRLTLSHIDAIIFGNILATLVMMQVVLFLKEKLKLIQVFLGCGILTGFAMTIFSQTRSSILILTASLLVLFLIKKQSTLAQKILGILAIAIGLIAIYLYIPFIKGRIDAAIYEIYMWTSGTNTQTSSGARISMWLLSSHLFLLNPISGYGDKNFSPAFLDNQDLIQRFGQMAVETVYCCGPHNEFFANLLRSGFWGGVAYVTTYILPMAIFLRHLICVNKNSTSASLGLIFTMCFFVAGLTNEMLSLKFIFSFYGIMMAIFLAEIHHEKR